MHPIIDLCSWGGGSDRALAKEWAKRIAVDELGASASRMTIARRWFEIVCEVAHDVIGLVYSEPCWGCIKAVAAALRQSESLKEAEVQELVRGF